MTKSPTEPTLEEACVHKGMRMTDQRRVIARVIEQSEDHPDVEELYRCKRRSWIGLVLIPVISLLSFSTPNVVNCGELVNFPVVWMLKSTDKVLYYSPAY